MRAHTLAAEPDLVIRIIGGTSSWIWLTPVLAVVGSIIVATATLYVMRRSLAESARQHNATAVASDRRELEKWRRDELLKTVSEILSIGKSVEDLAWPWETWALKEIVPNRIKLAEKTFSLEPSIARLQLLEPSESLSVKARGLHLALHNVAKAAGESREEELVPTKTYEGPSFKETIASADAAQESLIAATRGVLYTGVTEEDNSAGVNHGKRRCRRKRSTSTAETRHTEDSAPSEDPSLGD